MKTNLRQKAKSALSILLTLCMIFSVLTVGIASTSAAEVDRADTGDNKTFTQNSYFYVKNQAIDGWNANLWIDSSGVDIKLVSGDVTYNMSLYDGTEGDSSAVYRAKITTAGTYYGAKFHRYSGTNDWGNPTENWFKTTNGNYMGGSKVAGNSGADYTLSYYAPKVNTATLTIPGADSGSGTSSDPYILTVGNTYTPSLYMETDDCGATGFLWQTSSDYNSSSTTYHTATSSSANSKAYYTASLSTITPSAASSSNTALTYYSWCYQSARGTAHSTSSTSATVYYKVVPATTPLPTPTWSSSTVAVNAGTAATLTVSNHSTIKGQDSGVTYVLKKGSTTLTSGTDYTFDNSTGVFTLSDTTTSAAGTYTVQAIAADTATYEDSAASDSATVTVYEPLYCLVGNDIRDSAFLINGVEPSKTVPTGTDTWFNTWQESYAVKNTTVTPGVYSITFTVKDDYEWKPDVGIYHKTDGQKAFILNGEEYNTSRHGDLIVTDDGFDASDDLFAYNMGTPAGGTLVLKAGQTYTITIDQTQQYNSSSPYGKITVTASDVFADVAAKKQVFNATSGEYEAAADCEAAIGTATAVPKHNAGSLTTVLTAVDVNHNYDFIGWFNNAECSGSPVIAASACTESDYTYTKEVTISKTTEYYALFKQKQPSQYDVTLTQPSYGVISTTGGVSGGKAYQGATVSINATVTDNSKEFSHWLITNASDVDITSTVCANPTLQTTTFTMPASNVKVTAIYSNKTQVTITTSSNNTSLGTASYTSGTYYVGDTINISATNVGGVFSRWVVTGGTVANAGSASTTIVATGSTVTARAIFDYKTYQLYYNGKYYPLIRQDDGTYVSSFKIPSNSSDFTVYNASDKKYAVSGTGNTWEFNSGTRDATIYNTTTANNSAWASSAGKLYKNTSAGAAAYMVFYPPGYIIGSTTYGNGRISLVTTNPMGTIAQIYAKDGSIRYYDSGKSSGDLWEQSTGGPTANRGVTVVTKINSTAVSDPDSSKYPSTNPTLSDHVKIYSAPIGSTITIQTTLNDTYKNQGFYVGMFVINGWKVAASDAGKGVYTATYTLTDEYALNNLDSQKSFEITPVYYNKNFDYITFYVDADSVPDKWGSTISACADYNGATNAHFEGTYPGQPLGREGDLYELKVAKYYYDYSSTTGKWTAHTNYHPSATITAYNFDLVHHYYYVNASDDIYSAGTNNNYQTYDYSDFAYLAQIPNIEAILFRCKYETAQNNWRIFADSGSSAPTANYNATNPTWWAVDAHTSLLNSFEVLTDYYGNPIDAFGNRIIKSGTTYYTADDVSTILSEFSTDATDKIRIVSYGNRKTDDDSANSRTAAQWATGWAVFQGGADGINRKIAYGNPADFICTTPGTTSTSNVHYLNSKSASNLTGKLTFISYDNEKTNSISGVGDTGERIDGQWYYSAQHDFDSTVQVHITTAEGTAVKTSDTTVDADSSTAGTNDGWEGTTSKTVATLDGKTTETYSNVTTEAALNCTPGSGYTFVGWYIYDGTNYTKIGDNFADQNTAMTMKKNYTIVAVVRAVDAGDLVITHSRYTGSKPEAHDGTGKYYVSAVVTHSDSSTTTIAEAQNSITVKNLAATDKLTITIRTVCSGADTFYAWYEEALGADYSRTGNYYEICDENVDPLGESEVSYTFFEADCSTFFESGALARQTIDLYSDIVHVSAYATLTYKYYDRFAQNGANQMVSYIVKNVLLSEEEIENGYIPSDEKIAQYAPKVVDTIYTDTKWTITGTKVERAASNVTLMATQTPKTCFVEYIPNAQVATNLLAGKDTEVSVGDVVAWNTRIVDYNSWLINENADMSNPDESDFYVSAPETYTDETKEKTWTFVRFDVYEYDRLTGTVGDVLYSSNDHTFGYRIYADCVIYPVYTDQETVTKQLTAKIEPAVLNREVYGDSASPTDKLYADLLISFINVSAAANGEIPDEIKELAEDSGYTIETGFVLNKNVILSNTDFNTLKTAAEQGATDTTDTILTAYSSQFDQTVAANVAKGATVSGYSKYVLDNSKLTNKNRTDGVVRFSNTEAAQQKVYAAYSYIIIKKTDGTDVAFAISDAQLFNFCYLGNKPLETVS